MELGVAFEIKLCTIFFTSILGNISVLLACESYGSALRCTENSQLFLKWTKEHSMEEIETLFLSNIDLSRLQSDNFVGFSSVSKLIINDCLLTNEKAISLFGHFLYLTKISINHANVSDSVNIFIKNNKMLTKIEMNYNNITNICGMLFNNFSDLNEIDFSFNKVTHILTSWDPNEDERSQIEGSCGISKKYRYAPIQTSFSNLNSLMRINLKNNFIERVSKFTFGRLPMLSQLDLSHNRISDMEPFAFTLSKTPGAVSSSEGAVVNVSFNQLTHLQNDTFQRSDLVVHLDLSNNRIQSLPSGFLRGLPSLLHLNVSGNLLQDLEEGLFRSTRALRGLDLHDNRLREIPEGAFADLPELATLHLSRNRLSALNRSSFRGLLSLQVLLLQANELQALGDAFTGSPTYLPNLNTLDLSSNSLVALERAAFAGCPSLEHLQLASNDIELVTDYAFDGSESLKTLDLSGNNLNCLSCFSLFGLSSIEELYLSGNRLRKLQFVQLADLTLLRRLSLRLPPGTQCECAAFKWLQKHRVDVTLDPGAQDERCRALFEQFVEPRGNRATPETQTCEQEKGATSCECDGGGHFVDPRASSSSASTPSEANERVPESSTPADALLSLMSFVTVVDNNPSKSLMETLTPKTQTTNLSQTTVFVSRSVTFTSVLGITDEENGQTSLLTSSSSVLQTVKYSTALNAVTTQKIDVTTKKTQKANVVESFEFRVSFYVISIFLLLLCLGVMGVSIFKLVRYFRWRNHTYSEIEMRNV